MIGANFLSRLRGRAPAGEDPSGRLGFGDRALTALAMLNGDLGTAYSIRQNAAKSAAMQAARQAQSELPGIFTPTVKAYNGMAGPTEDGSQPASTSIPYAQRRAMIPNIKDPATIRKLLELEGRGADISSALKIGEALVPDVKVEAGWGYDPSDPKNAGRFFEEAPEKGMRPLFDQDGKHVGWQNSAGAVQGLAERAGAVAEAEAAAKAKYDTVTGEDALGRPMVTRKMDVVGPQGSPLVGQSEADKASAVKLGQATGEAQANLPIAEETAAQTLSLIGQLRDHPGRRLATGGTGIIPAIPGTSQKDYIALLDQAKGKAFLEAFATLKGGGQITEVEGRKATEAIARLDRTQSEGGFLQALTDLEQIVNGALARSRQKAGQGYAKPGQPSRGSGMRTQGAGFKILSVE